MDVHGHTIKKTRSRFWGACYKIINPDGTQEHWGSPRDLVYHETEEGAYWYVIRKVQDKLLNQLDSISCL